MSHTIRLEVKNAHNPSATPVDGKYPVDIIRKVLRVDEVFPDSLRWNPTLGRVEYSPDGTNWYPSPENDPRNNPAAEGRKGETDNCPAAKSVAEYFHRYITLVTGLLSSGAGLVQGASTILAFLDLLGGYGILIDVISGVFGTLVGYGASSIETAFTSDQYDKLKCILLCTMNNSQLDANSLAVTKQMVTAQLNATAAPIVNLMLDLMGFAGVNRAGAFYTVAGDCSACPSCDWVFSVDLTWLWANGFVMPARNFSAAPPAMTSKQDVLTSLDSFAGHPAWKGSGNVAGLTQWQATRAFYLPIPSGATLTNIQVYFSRATGNWDSFYKTLMDLSTGAYQDRNGAFTGPPSSLSGSWSNINLPVYFSVRANVITGTVPYITQVKITGTGQRPAIPYVATLY